MANSHTLIQTAKAQSTTRLDKLLVQLKPDLDRETIRHIIQDGQVLIDGQTARKPGQILDAGAQVKADFSDLPEPEAKPTRAIPLTPVPVLYEDEDLLVVEKPAGMHARPSSRITEDTLMQNIARSYPEITHIGGVERGGIVHRVDPEVSGPVLIARHTEAYRALKRRRCRERFEYLYSALVEGYLSGQGLIDQPVGNVKQVRGRLAVSREGRQARTRYHMQRHFKCYGRDYSLLEVQPVTSRRHQIRVHLAWYGFPIVGDQEYGSTQQPLLPMRLFLHLSVLAFPHPQTGKMVRVESALPPDLHEVLRYLTHPKIR